MTGHILNAGWPGIKKRTIPIQMQKLEKKENNSDENRKNFRKARKELNSSYSKLKIANRIDKGKELSQKRRYNFRNQKESCIGDYRFNSS